MFTFTLVTPEKKLIAGAELTEVFVPAYRGELNILTGHAPLMTTLETGILKYRLKGDSQLHLVAISWGYCQVNPEGVSVVAETAERPEEIDVERVKTALADARKHLAAPGLSPEDIEKYQAKVARSEARMLVANSALRATGKGPATVH